MTDRREPPWSQVSERALLAALCLRSDPEKIPEASDVVSAEDFYAPLHGHCFAAMVALHAEGQAVDVTSVAARVALETGRSSSEIVSELVAMTTEVGNTQNLVTYARPIAATALNRRLIAVAAEMAEGAWAAGDPADLIDAARTMLAGLDAPGSSADAPHELWTTEDFMSDPVAKRAPWVVPGLFRSDTRALVVAIEGYGKSWVSRQVAWCAAQGIHPFTTRPIEPIRTLVVDLENPRSSIVEQWARMGSQLVQASGGLYQAERSWIWHHQPGINLRTREGRRSLEAKVAFCRPQLVVIGPAYKAYRVGKFDSDEQAASEVQGCLDDLRDRYGFALMLEHHAPKGARGEREILPFGSSLWLRWPELGIAFHPTDDGSLRVGRWRPDRQTVAWPDRLDRSQTWPWIGYYPAGMDAATGDEQAF